MNNSSSSSPALCQIWFDDLNLYIETRILKSLPAKIYMAALGLFFAIPGATILWMGGGPAIPIAVMVFAAWNILISKLVLWNIFGKELIILNTKSVSYQRSYGIIETNLRTQPFQHLRIASVVTKENSGMEYSKLQFYNYNEHGLPELLLESSIALPEQYIAAIFQHANNMFAPEEGFPPISLN